MHAVTANVPAAPGVATADPTVVVPLCVHCLKRWFVSNWRQVAIEGSRETTANLSRLADGSLESASTTAQKLGIACSAAFASCSAAEREVEDGVGAVVVLVKAVVVEGAGLGSFAVQADVAVITDRATATAIRLLAVVISSLLVISRPLKEVCDVDAVKSNQDRSISTSAVESV
jgi:hypothetical protein